MKSLSLPGRGRRRVGAFENAEANVEAVDSNASSILRLLVAIGSVALYMIWCNEILEGSEMRSIHPFTSW